MYKCWDPICRLTPHVGDLCIEILAYNCSGDERDLSECQETDGMCNPSSDIVGVVCEVCVYACTGSDKYGRLLNNICQQKLQ
jgi:hypothetical protein